MTRTFLCLIGIAAISLVGVSQMATATDPSSILPAGPISVCPQQSGSPGQPVAARPNVKGTDSVVYVWVSTDASHGWAQGTWIPVGLCSTWPALPNAQEFCRAELERLLWADSSICDSAGTIPKLLPEIDPPIWVE